MLSTSTRWLSFIAFLAATLAVACGAPPPTAPDTSEDLRVAIGSDEATAAAQANTDATPGFSLTDAAAGNTNGVEVQPTAAAEAADAPSDSEFTAAGLPVGFTAEGRAYIGQLDAPVVIEEFSDFQCPFCGRFTSQTFPSLLENAVANGEVVFIFHDFPLDFHPQAVPAALAARCAGEQGAVAYWQMHDKLFADIDKWTITAPEANLKALAADLELDTAAFNSCLDEGRYLPEIEADIALGRQRGVTGTPTFFLNNQVLVGAQPTAAFERAIALVQSGESIAAAPAQESPDPQVQGTVEIPPFRMPDQITFDEASYAAVLGDPDAPFLIVEFSDYQCPFCQRHFSEVMPLIREQLIDTGRVRYAFRDFPLDEIHPEARSAAVAARCAGEQERYWEMHDWLFANQTRWAGQASLAPIFTQAAADLGLDTADFERCYTSGRWEDKVQADVDEGLSVGVRGTPAFFINGYYVSGARPFELFDLVISNSEEGTLEKLFRDAYEQQVAALRAQQGQADQPAGPQPAEVDIEGAIAFGNEDAPVTIVEFTDFQCPYCSRHSAETFPLIKENYIDTGLVRYVFKDFPLNIHPQAPLAAEAARCANEQEAFLPMHDVLFARQSEWSGRNDAGDLFVVFATDLGLDEASFRECLESGKYTAAVSADLQQGIALGVSGTPSFYVNGSPIVGAIPYASFAQALETLLTEE